MMLSEAIAQIKMQLGFRRDRDLEIQSCLINAQRELEARIVHPWFLLSEIATIATTTNEPRIVKPADFIAECEDFGLYYVPTDTTLDEVELSKFDEDVLRIRYARTKVGAPEAYASAGSYFIIFPTPDAAYTLQTKYYKRDTELATDIENKWLKYAPTLLMGLAGQYIAGASRDTAAAAEFSRWEQRGMVSLIAQNVEHKSSNQYYQIGGEE